MPLDNSSHYPKIVEILSKRTTKTTNIPVRGIRMGLLAELTDQDIEYFNTALVFKLPNNHVALLDGINLPTGGVLAVPEQSEEDGISRFLTVAGQYFYDKLKVSTMTVIYPDDEHKAFITPSPFTPPNMAKLNAHINDLHKAAGTTSEREHKKR